MENKIGLFLAFLGFLGIFITLTSNTSEIGKSILVIVFFVMMVIGILLQTPIGNIFKEKVEY